MTFHVAVLIAMSFWGHRDVTIPCNPTPVVVEDAALPTVNNWPALAATYGAPRCQILLSHALQWWRREDPGYYCTVITHEVGHVGGLPHGPGVMNPNGPTPGVRDTYTWPCRVATK